VSGYSICSFCGEYNHDCNCEGKKMRVEIATLQKRITELEASNANLVAALVGALKRLDLIYRGHTTFTDQLRAVLEANRGKG
jgi:hypothetical protein